MCRLEINDGVMWCALPTGATATLTVAHGVVVKVVGGGGHRWALRRDVHQLWRDIEARGATIVFTPRIALNSVTARGREGTQV